ncbi:MAG TPA: GNAT family N-acetyltransferase [Marmoricola sp.]|jgi:GNAT superfamily N-acetyltransferase|nr:GNAT family N-acetyltransferase [Marmoricola sp.]
MSRSALSIRDARPEDLEAVLELWGRAGSGGQSATPRPMAEARTALAEVAADPDERLIVGLHEGTVVAAMHLRRGPISPIHLESAVHTSYLLVDPEYRKHGFAHALLESAVSWAEEKDIEHVTAITSGNRDTNRFFARLGLGDIATVRACSTSVLRHKLTPESRRPHPSRRNLSQVLAERRAVRRVEPARPEADQG